MRAEQILPDHADSVDVGGVTIRKGTIAAFFANARVRTDPSASETARGQAAADIREALPALRASGLFDFVMIRDPQLREWIDSGAPTHSATEARS
ncbi:MULTISPECIES: hypothetical protein [Paraburkholderia]|jgi:hypothetical protein|uniref:Preprotein translocase subunit SecD n=1 Tax=Paraburkholderia graminis TaxID=60548 RepID=A0ABD5CRD8_9BURK|nr:hypothetical protein [Paraburkholderia graminis]MDR6207105.1 hypothetical protein [Paraburkholderia graminis]